MNLLQPTDESQLKQVILHYKKFYLSLGIILACIGLFLWVILPQIQQYTDQRAQIQEAQDRVDKLQRNVSALARISSDEQATQLQTAIKALPGDKDFAGILYAVRAASAKSGVGIGDFTFSIGELSSQDIITKDLPFISMNLNVIGDIKGVSAFLTELAKTLPLSNVTEIRLNGRLSNIIILFYYKPIPQLRVNFLQPIFAIAGDNKTLLDTLSNWEAEKPILDAPVSTESSSSAGFTE